MMNYRDVYVNLFAPRLKLERGEGAYLWDSEGKRYLDLLAGIATSSLGYNHPAHLAALSQASKLIHVSNLFTTQPQIDLAAKLVELYASEAGRSGRVFLCNSGTEANEAALKLAMLHKPGGKILGLEGGFHGRTLGALSVTWKPELREGFAQIPDTGFIAPSIEALETIDDSVAAVIVEPIQGEVGVRPLPEGFLGALRAACDRAGALLIVDEVQTGMGRCGRWFAHTEHIAADVITLAKGLGGGYPIGAVIAAGDAAELYTPGSHGTTFGGNPLGAAMGLATIEVIADLLESVGETGRYLRGRLADSGYAVRGSGLLLGVEVDDAPGMQAALQEAGFLVNATGATTLRLAPPLIATERELAPFADHLETMP